MALDLRTGVSFEVNSLEIQNDVDNGHILVFPYAAPVHDTTISRFAPRIMAGYSVTPEGKAALTHDAEKASGDLMMALSVMTSIELW